MMENFIHDKYGWCFYVIEPDKNPIIFNLFTKPEFRERGFAKKHIEYVINEIRDNGYKGDIEIYAKPKEKEINIQRLVTFYKGLGLKVISV